MPCNIFRGPAMTLGEAQRLVLGRPAEYPYDRKIGSANNARRAAGWDRAQLAVLDPGPMVLCGDMVVPMCTGAAGCDHVGDLLCDWPVGRGKTCDLGLCAEHAHQIAEDRHLCQLHWPMWVEKTRADRVNPWPPKRRS